MIGVSTNAKTTRHRDTFENTFHDGFEQKRSKRVLISK